ncbi:unnamed protein product [Cuscuta europaea]|nr:unnamed protein product [Cuscuta europaea]
MLTTTKSSRDMEKRKYSFCELKIINGHMRVGEQTSTENSGFGTHMYASYGAYDSSMVCLKIVCTFGGKGRIAKGQIGNRTVSDSMSPSSLTEGACLTRITR